MPFPPPGYLPDSGTEPAFQADSSPEMQVQSLSQEDPLEKGMAADSSFLTRKMPWTKEPGGLQFMGLQRVEHDEVIKTATATISI